MDKKDWLLLQTLEIDARASAATLGELIGLSKTPTWTRIQALEHAGVIAGYEARLNPLAIGLTVTAHIAISVESARHQAFEAAIQQHDAVLECYTITGNADYLLTVMVRDLDALDSLLRQSLSKLPGVERIATTICMKTIKKRSAIIPCLG